MYNRQYNSLKKYLFFILFFAASFFVTHTGSNIAAEEALQPAVRELAQKAFSQKNEAAVRQVFEKNLAKLPNAQAQCQALTLLAEYELYNNRYSQAAEHYRQAAALNTDLKTALQLEAVRIFLCGGSFDAARSLLSAIAAELPVSDENSYYRTAAVYDAWRLLAEDQTDRALSLINTYTKKKSFSDYHPALLFTLWWMNGDEKAKQRLLKEYPSGMEAAAIRGTVTVQPSTFWYLMPRNSQAPAQSTGTVLPQPAKTAAAQNVPIQSAEASAPNTAAQEPVKQSTASETSSPLYYQLGFYRTEKYAEALAADLQKKHFVPIIKEELRPSGTVYFAVLVKENEAGDMGLRLKAAGYEAFPIFP